MIDPFIITTGLLLGANLWLIRPKYTTHGKDHVHNYKRKGNIYTCPTDGDSFEVE